MPYEAPAHRLVNRFKVIDGDHVQSPTSRTWCRRWRSSGRRCASSTSCGPAQPDDFSLQTSGLGARVLEEDPGVSRAGRHRAPGHRALVGSIVIMNIMLVAVAERTHEIGIRKALGAKRSDILSQFLAESTTLASSAPRVGIAAGFGLAELIAAVSPLPAAVALWSIVVGVARRRRRRDHLRRLSGDARGAARSDRRAAAGVARCASVTAWPSLAEGVVIAIDALRANKVRAALTILGIAIGVFVVVLMSAAIHGINSSVAAGVREGRPDDVLRLSLPDRARGVRRRRGQLQVAQQPAAQADARRRRSSGWRRCRT